MTSKWYREQAENIFEDQKALNELAIRFCRDLGVRVGSTIHIGDIGHKLLDIKGAEDQIILCLEGRGEEPSTPEHLEYMWSPDGL